MSGPLVAELEWLAEELVERQWVARAALVSDAGEVLAVCTPSGRRAATEPPSSPAGTAPPGALVARLAVEPLDDQSWIYVDLGPVRLLAQLARPAQARAATSWLSTELRRLGVTVERDTAARER